MGLFSFLTQDIALDLGTANTLIIMDDKVVVDEPSILPVCISLATIDGSSTTTLSSMIISVLAVPKSSAMSCVKKLNNPIFFVRSINFIIKCSFCYLQI